MLVAGAAVVWRSGDSRPPPPPAPTVQLREALTAALPGNTREAPRLSNPAAYLPAQCYAVTQEAPGGRTRNGCFACHQAPRAPNYVEDAEVQTVLTVARAAEENRWTNLVRPPPSVNISDAELLAWVRASNYVDERGGLRLAAALAQPPAAWDGNGNGRWEGYTPDCWFQPDAEGFDRSPDGAMTGWRAFAYAPFPGMFWPTNGSAGDVFIRLPAAFRRDRDGRESTAVYRLNLAILEAYLRRVDVPLPPTDERELGSDLDGDGVLGTARRVAFVWPPKQGRPFGYVGEAAGLDRAKDGWPAAGLYPRGTEFLHSLRYLDVEGGQVRMAARMKELRYMRKTRWLTYSDLQLAAEAEAREKEKQPDKLKRVLADVERGVGTGTGWLMQGFIEDSGGELRPQNVEETTACIGCHGGVGATTDSTFSFARKLDTGSAWQGGWYHWGQRGLKGIPEPRRTDGQGEYAHWLAQVGAGDDYGTNDEVQARFFRKDGTLRPDAVKALTKDISVLLVPSPSRALLLDRATLALVKAQRFERGRDVTVGAPPKVRARLEQDGATGITEAVLPGWMGPEKSASR
ncbi:Putative lipoprotein [Archangium gephyra]|uniref:Lipoprotein n=1 Tax=Archangium gephyra TaxID=48 RepID=A0AAC8Q566_9BACT|nr:Putative lipoprotein [Archangium gephyra]